MAFARGRAASPKDPPDRVRINIRRKRQQQRGNAADMGGGQRRTRREIVTTIRLGGQDVLSRSAHDACLACRRLPGTTHDHTWRPPRETDDPPIPQQRPKPPANLLPPAAQYPVPTESPPP